MIIRLRAFKYALRFSELLILLLCMFFGIPYSVGNNKLEAYSTLLFNKRSTYDSKDGISVRTRNRMYAADKAFADL